MPLHIHTYLLNKTGHFTSKEYYSAHLAQIKSHTVLVRICSNVRVMCFIKLNKICLGKSEQCTYPLINLVLSRCHTVSIIFEAQGMRAYDYR